MVSVDTEEHRSGVIEKGFQQVVPAACIIVCSYIPQENDHVLHGGMYFIYKVSDTVDSAVDIAREIDHRSSSFRTLLY